MMGSKTLIVCAGNCGATAEFARYIVRVLRNMGGDVDACRGAAAKDTSQYQSRHHAAILRFARRAFDTGVPRY